MKRQNGSDQKLHVLCFALTIFGAFAQEYTHSDIIESNSSDDGLGNYQFQFRTLDGTTRWQTGRLQYVGDKPYIRVEGGYSYIDREQGVKRIVTFVADQDGYRPTYSQEPITIPPPQAFPSRFGSAAAGG